MTVRTPDATGKSAPGSGAAPGHHSPGGPRAVTPGSRRPTIVFDLDGTLVDSAPDMQAAANRILGQDTQSGITLAQARRFIGDGIPRFVERILAATGATPTDPVLADATARFLADYAAHAAVLTKPYPGVMATLARLTERGHRLAICTNKPQGASKSLLEALGLVGYFDCIAGGDRYPVKKPHPGHLFALLSELACRPTDALMVGDSENDAETARAAGVPFVLLSYGYARTPLPKIPATYRLDSFAELLTLPPLARRAD